MFEALETFFAHPAVTFGFGLIFGGIISPLIVDWVRRRQARKGDTRINVGGSSFDVESLTPPFDELRYLFKLTFYNPSDEKRSLHELRVDVFNKENERVKVFGVHVRSTEERARFVDLPPKESASGAFSVNLYYSAMGNVGKANLRRLLGASKMYFVATERPGDTEIRVLIDHDLEEQFGEAINPVLR